MNKRNKLKKKNKLNKNKLRKNNKIDNKNINNNTKIQNLPFVSICTPIYKRKEFLKILKKCVLSQDYPHKLLEWVILDDSPTNELIDIIKDIKFCKYYYYPYKMKLSDKRNYIHTFCKGDIIIYMDSDDWYPPTRVSHAVDVLINNKNILIVGSSLMFLYYIYQNRIYQCGPYHDFHATAATFAFKKELLLCTRYDPNKEFAEESSFLKQFTFPMKQLDPIKTILVIIHDDHTTDKDKILENKKKVLIKDTTYNVEDFINNKIFKKINSKSYNIDEIIKFYKMKGKLINMYGKKYNNKKEGKKIISYCLWGDNDMYLNGALENIKLAKKIYPDWICRFYIPDNKYGSINNIHPTYKNNLDNSNNNNNNKICRIPDEIINKLKNLGAEIFYKNQIGNWSSMLWRFEAILDKDVDIMISRDCDSRLSFREKRCIDEWIKSDYGFHIIRDHKWHTTRILGGLWGVKKTMVNLISRLEILLDEYKKLNNNYYQNDQYFLRDKIYPIIKNNCIIHSEFIKYEDEHVNNFLSKRYKDQYVGQPYDSNNFSLISLNKIIYNPNNYINDDKREIYELDSKYIILNTSFSGSESWYEYEELFNKMFKDYIYINKNPKNINFYNMADIVIYGSRTIKRYNKENKNAKYIYISIEGHDYSDIVCDLLIDTKYLKKYKNIYNTEDGKKKYIYFPYYSLSFLHRRHTVNDLIKKFTDKQIDEILKTKTKFCAFIYTHGDTFRDSFFKELSLYKKVDAIGVYLNNQDNKTFNNKNKRNLSLQATNIKLIDRFEYDYKTGKQLYLDNCVDIYKSYKFVICFENDTNKEEIQHYITEKIINCMLANSIPIYYGCKEINYHFNVESFININDFKNIKSIVKYIKKLDNNIELYKKKLLQPWLINNKLNKYLTWHNNKSGHYITDEINKYLEIF